MSKNSFSKPPLTSEEKAKKAAAFINQEDMGIKNEEENEIKKVPSKKILLRFPQTYLDDIKKIMALTGLSRNAICLELLRPALKKKLKEILEG